MKSDDLIYLGKLEMSVNMIWNEDHDFSDQVRSLINNRRDLEKQMREMQVWHLGVWQ